MINYQQRLRKASLTLYRFLEENSFLISIILLLVAFVLFYPSTYVAVDEHNYLHTAQNIVEGTLRDSCEPNDWSQFQYQNYCFYKYNIGTAFFLLPFLLIGLRGVFVSVLLMHLLGVYFFKKLTEYRELNRIFIFLYALFPAFIYYYRTLYSEVFTATLILGGFYYLLRFLDADKEVNLKRYMKFGLFSGAFLGMAVLVRYTNIFVVAGLFGTMFIYQLVEKVRARHVSGLKNTVIAYIRGITQIAVNYWPIAVGALPFAIFFFWINNYIYGDPLKSGYYFSGEERVFGGVILRSFLLYTLSLTLLYPGMLVAPPYNWFKNSFRKEQLAILTVTALFILFYSGSWAPKFEGRPLDLIQGLRYFLPVVPLLIYSYSLAINSFVNRSWKFRATILLLIIGLVGNLFLLSYLHQEYLELYPEIDKIEITDIGIRKN